MDTAALTMADADRHEDDGAAATGRAPAAAHDDGGGLPIQFVINRKRGEIVAERRKTVATDRAPTAAPDDGGGGLPIQFVINRKRGEIVAKRGEIVAERGKTVAGKRKRVDGQRPFFEIGGDASEDETSDDENADEEEEEVESKGLRIIKDIVDGMEHRLVREIRRSDGEDTVALPSPYQDKEKMGSSDPLFITDKMSEEALGDLMAGRTPGRTMRRYFGGERRCWKCSQVGHLASECDRGDKPCYFCGIPGHESNKCPQSRCIRCLETGHFRIDCQKTLSRIQARNLRVFCYRCGCRGHDPNACGLSDYRINLDLHQTTCLVCGKKGHINCAMTKLAKTRPTWPPCCNCGDGRHPDRLCTLPRFSSDKYSFGSRAGQKRSKSAGPTSGRKPPTCFHCNEKGHFVQECPKIRLTRGLHCYVCGGEGHLARDCFAKHRERWSPGGRLSLGKGANNKINSSSRDRRMTRSKSSDNIWRNFGKGSRTRRKLDHEGPLPEGKEKKKKKKKKKKSKNGNENNKSDKKSGNSSRRQKQHLQQQNGQHHKKSGKRKQHQQQQNGQNQQPSNRVEQNRKKRKKSRKGSFKSGNNSFTDHWSPGQGVSNRNSSHTPSRRK